MSINDGKFEVYVVGYDESDFVSKNYISKILLENNFNLTNMIENADFILLLEEYRNTLEAGIALQYSEMDKIEIAESLEDLLRYRDEAQFRESAVN